MFRLSSLSKSKFYLLIVDLMCCECSAFPLTPIYHWNVFFFVAPAIARALALLQLLLLRLTHTIFLLRSKRAHIAIILPFFLSTNTLSNRTQVGMWRSVVFAGTKTIFFFFHSVSHCNDSPNVSIAFTFFFHSIYLYQLFCWMWAPSFFFLLLMVVAVLCWYFWCMARS